MALPKLAICLLGAPKNPYSVIFRNRGRILRRGGGVGRVRRVYLLDFCELFYKTDSNGLNLGGFCSIFTVWAVLLF